MNDERKLSDSKRLRALIKAINKEKETIGRHRDRIRDLADEAAAIADDCDEAYDQLVTAADTLSKFL